MRPAAKGGEASGSTGARSASRSGAPSPHEAHPCQSCTQPPEMAAASATAPASNRHILSSTPNHTQHISHRRRQTTCMVRRHARRRIARHPVSMCRMCPQRGGAQIAALGALSQRCSSWFSKFCRQSVVRASSHPSMKFYRASSRVPRRPSRPSDDRAVQNVARSARRSRGAASRRIGRSQAPGMRMHI